MQSVLLAALDVAFFALVAITLVTYVRRRTPIRRDTVLVFASVGLVLALPIVTAMGKQLGLWDSLPVAISAPFVIFFLAQPFLTMFLIRHFRERMGGALLVSFLLFVGSTAAVLYYAVGPPAVTGETAPLIVSLGVVAYFGGVNLLAAVFFADESRRRAGAARIRLAMAAMASILFGTAILVGGAEAAISPQAGGASASGQEPAASAIASLVLAVLAALGFLLAFAPPRFLRRFWQRAVAYDYLRDLVMDPDGDEQTVLWHRLSAAAREVTGARASAVGVGSYEAGAEISAADGDWRGRPPIGMRLDGADLRSIGPFNAIGRKLDSIGASVQPLVERSGARRVGSIPIATDTGTHGILLLFMARTPLFVEDDLMLLDVLNAHTARAVERDKVLGERTALVSQLRMANHELAHASAAKSDFLAAMSHELRTPLHAIIGFSELLLTSPEGNGQEQPTDDANVKEFAGHIHGAGLHLLELINDVLDLAKVEAGRLDLVLEPFDISALVHRTARTMRPIAARKRVTLEIPESAGIEIEADAARVRQIVFNLISNAIKFTPSGGLVVVSLEATGDEIRLTVADTGPGIAPADRQRIFEPFEQSWQRDGPRQEGTGLGLALTRQLVDGHGGRIELDSEVDRGSRFTVILPRATGRTLAPRPEPLDGSAGPVPSDGRPLVLVVEDDPRARELMTINLRDSGYAVATAENGLLALERVRDLRPAAVILDVILPELDGWEVLRELKARPDTADIPVIITSVVEDADVGFALGAVDYLVKPVGRDEILMHLRRLEIIGGRPPDGVMVLAIDDDLDTLQLYRAELEPSGFRVLTADSGALGVRMAREHRPTAILLDLVMPEMDGFAVAAELHADPATRDVPIIVLTSHDVTAADKALLNGTVRQVVIKGPDAATALLDWLQRVTRPAERFQPAPATTGPDAEDAVAERATPAGVAGGA